MSVRGARRSRVPPALWIDALKHFRYEADQAEAARAWAGEHTWANRAELLKHTFG